MARGFLIPLILVVVIGSVQAQEPSGLFMYRQTPQHTGMAHPGESLRVPLRRLWTYETVNVGIHSASKSSPIADETQVYVGADNERFYALDKRTGELKWQWESRPCRFGIHATPAVDESRVYIGDYGGWLTALDKKTGDVAWEIKLGGSIGGSAIIVGDRVYVAVETETPDGYLAAVDRVTGKRLFEQPSWFGDHSHCTPTFDLRTDRIYLGSNRALLHCINGKTGQQIGQFAVRGAPPVLPKTGPRPMFRAQIKSTAALVGNRVLFTSWDRRLYCLDLSSSDELWNFKTIQRTMSSPSVDSETGRVYFGSNDYKVYAVDLSNGAEIWRFRTGDKVISSSVIVPRKDNPGKLVVIGSHDAFLYALDDESGEVVWKEKLDGPISNVPCVSDGKLYVSTDGGQLVCWE